MCSRHFIHDTEGQLSEAFFIADPMRVRETIGEEHTILTAIGMFIEGAPDGLRLFVVTEIGAKDIVEEWLGRLVIPLGVTVEVLDVAPEGKISGAEWARDHVLVRLSNAGSEFIAPVTDATTIGMHQNGENAFALWLSGHFSQTYLDLRDVFLPGGEILSGQETWITSRSKEPTSELEALSDQDLIYFEYYVGDSEEEIAEHLQQKASFYRGEIEIKSSERIPRAARRKFVRSNEESLRSEIDANEGFVSFGLHVDNLLTLTGVNLHGKPVVVLAKREPVGISGFSRRQVLRGEKYLQKTANRLVERGFEVVRNPIPVTRVDGKICDLCYNNALVEGSVRVGHSKPLIMLPGFGLDDPLFAEFDDANRTIWEALGFDVKLFGGWKLLAPADGALRCAINVMHRL